MGNGKCHNENVRCRYMLTGQFQKKNTAPVKTMFSFYSLFQYTDFPIVSFSAGMERHTCDIFHRVFRLEAFQVLLCLPQFVDMFQKAFVRLYTTSSGISPRVNITILTAMVWTSLSWFG